MFDYSINDQVTVIIHNYSPAGLLGRVVNGPRAIIRHREIAWKNTQSLDYYVNKTLKAIILNYDPSYGQLELSLRFIERDPWKDIAINYPPGKEVGAKIVGLIEGAAFAELEPGVDAFLPINELPPISEPRIENLLWLNDEVRVSVIEVIPQKRRLRVSLHPLLIKREKKIHHQLWDTQDGSVDESATLAEFLPKDTRLKLLRMGAMEDPQVVRRKRLRVLMIEDDEAFSIGLQCFLRSNGCHVVSVIDGEKG